MPVCMAWMVSASRRLARSQNLAPWVVRTGGKSGPVIRSAVPSSSSDTVAVPLHCGVSTSCTTPTCSRPRSVNTRYAIWVTWWSGAVQRALVVITPVCRSIDWVQPETLPVFGE